MLNELIMWHETPVKNNMILVLQTTKHSDTSSSSLILYISVITSQSLNASFQNVTNTYCLVNFYHSVLCYRGIFCRRVSVHLSVTSQYCIKMARLRILDTTLYDSPVTLVYWCKRSLWNFIGGHPQWGRQVKVVYAKIGDFRPIQHLAISQKWCKTKSLTVDV